MERGEGIERKNNEAIVFNLMCDMSQPIRTTNDLLRKIIKTHRKLDLSYQQMRTILESLYHKGKITTEKDGNLTIISTILPNDLTVYQQPLSHKKHNTPTYVYEFYRLITRDAKYEGISMEDAAKKIFYNPYEPDDYNSNTAERKIRDAYNGIRTGRYVMRNGMPFETYICSETKARGRGYYLPKNEEELNEYLKKKKIKQLEAWGEYWYEVQWASRDGQIKYQATKNEKAIHEAVKNEREGII